MKKTLSLGFMVIISSLVLISPVFAGRPDRSPMPSSGSKVFNPGSSRPEPVSRPAPQSRNPQQREQSGNVSFGRPSAPAKIFNPAERPALSPQVGDRSIRQKPANPTERYNRPFERPSTRPIEKPSSAKIYKPFDRPAPSSPYRDNPTIEKPVKPAEHPSIKPLQRPSSAKIYKPGDRPESKPVYKPSVVKPIKEPLSSAKIYKPVERSSTPRIERPSSKPVLRPFSDSSRQIARSFSSPDVEKRSFPKSETRQSASRTHVPRESRENRESWRHDRYDRSHDRDSYMCHRPSYRHHQRHHDWTDYWGLGFRYSWDDFSIYVNAGWDWRWDLDYYYYHSSPYWYWDTYYYGDDFGISFTSGYSCYRPCRVWVAGYWSPVYDLVSYYGPYGEILWRSEVHWSWVPGCWDYRSW